MFMQNWYTLVIVTEFFSNGCGASTRELNKEILMNVADYHFCRSVSCPVKSLVSSVLE